MRRFIAATVLHPVTTTMVTIAVVLFGLVAATRLPVELLPDLSYPTITVRTAFEDAAPAEVEELVTRPLEERVGAVPGLVRVESSSREGVSEVVLDFQWGNPIDRAMADVREKLDRVRLPATAERPIVLRYDPAAEPILRLALRGPSHGDISDDDLAALRTHADKLVKRQLEKIAGVAAVEIHGGQEEEVVVELDPQRVAALGLTTDDIAAAIQSSNVNRAGGAVTEKNNRFLIRTMHEARTAEELAATVVRSVDGADLYLRDVADVRRSVTERQEMAFVDGAEAVELAVYREGDANIVAVAAQVQAALPRLALPHGHEVVVLSNRATFIESAVREVVDNTLVGGALAICVLLFFLRDLRSTVVIALAIPISLLATFIPLSALEVSLNVMSLGGLALGVGMLVDNSIVVLEAIARVRERAARRGVEQTPRAIAVEGTAEVAPSVLASTLTTVAVFFPMAFVDGVAGQLVRDLAYAVSFSIVSSMLVSLTLVPVLAGLGGRGDAPPQPPVKRSLVAYLVAIPALVAWPIVMAVKVVAWCLHIVTRPLTAAWDFTEGRYPGVLRIALRVRGVVLMLAVGVCVVTLSWAEQRPRTLLPEVTQGDFFVQVRLPQGASLRRTAGVMRALSGSLADDEDIERRFVRVGSLTQAGSASGDLTGEHVGQIDIRLRPEARDRQRTIEERVATRLSEAMLNADATLRLDRPALFSFAPPIEVQVFGEDATAVAAAVERIVPDLRALDGLTEVVPDDLTGRPEVRVRFDRVKLGRLGIAVDQASLVVQRAIQGEVVSTLFAVDDQLDIRVRLPEVDRSDVTDVSRIQVGVVDGVPVLLGQVADVEPAQGAAEIRRIDGRRGIRISARTLRVDLQGVSAAVGDVVDAHVDDDPDVTTTLGGQADEMQVSLRSLAFTAALSIFLVYVVMASSFESLLHPLLILFTVPLALAGVSVAIVWASSPISAMVGIGVIVLGGIVVNNAIVLINAINDRRGQGMDVREAVLQAGGVRVRPILMTTATTVLGLLPMALGLGDGAALRQPLAIAIIGGLTMATLLTLVVIPCAYALLPGGTRDAWRPRPDEALAPPADPKAAASSTADAGKSLGNEDPAAKPVPAAKTVPAAKPVPAGKTVPAGAIEARESEPPARGKTVVASPPVDETVPYGAGADDDAPEPPES
ncbi:MAG: efflux RND transporter permease subunit [Myxococcota bacterium]